MRKGPQVQWTLVRDHTQTLRGGGLVGHRELQFVIGRSPTYGGLTKGMLSSLSTTMRGLTFGFATHWVQDHVLTDGVTAY